MLGLINKLRRYRWAVLGRKKIKALVQHKHKQGEAIKIILGSSDHNDFNGEWINTDIPQFDITNAKHWEYIFGDIKIDNLLAEHVMEHLTKEQNQNVVAFMIEYLKPGANFRFAVPDGNHPDPKYIDYVKPNGNGPGCDDHKMLWTIDQVKEIFPIDAFDIHPLEYYDSRHEFFSVPFTSNAGPINRTFQNTDKSSWEFKNYTSLIFDFTRKPIKH